MKDVRLTWTELDSVRVALEMRCEFVEKQLDLWVKKKKELIDLDAIGNYWREELIKVELLKKKF